MDAYDPEGDFAATGSVRCDDCGTRVWPRSLESLPEHGCAERQRAHRTEPMSDCTCHAPADAEPEDHDFGCPELPECGHDNARSDDVECPECGCDLALLDQED